MPTDLPPYLSTADIDAVVDRGLSEDIGQGDVTSLATLAPETRAEARFLAKATGVLAGLVVAERVFSRVDSGLAVDWSKQDGEALRPGDRFGTVTGSARSLLTAERLALNILQRMSGIATATRLMVDAARPHPARILDTRKTAPGLRLLDKWAVLLGGGANHRVGLYDMILIKDNHIAACGGVAEAIEAALRFRRSHPGLQIQIEARTLDEVREVIQIGGVELVLLDNMVTRKSDGTIEATMLREAVTLIGGRFITEASGNVDLDTVSEIAATGVDRISSGALTHSVRALDLSLKIALDL